MIFATPSGQGVCVNSPAQKRQRPELDETVKAFARAETFERYLGLNFTVKTIATIFGRSERAIHADLRRLREERERRAAAGYDPLPLLGT